MKLIPNKRSWIRYRNMEYPLYYEVCEPEEYPCYVYEIVLSFPNEETAPAFLYKKDLEDMLSKMSIAKRSDG